MPHKLSFFLVVPYIFFNATKKAPYIIVIQSNETNLRNRCATKSISNFVAHLLRNKMIIYCDINCYKAFFVAQKNIGGEIFEIKMRKK